MKNDAAGSKTNLCPPPCDFHHHHHLENLHSNQKLPHVRHKLVFDFHNFDNFLHKILLKSQKTLEKKAKKPKTLTINKVFQLKV